MLVRSARGTWAGSLVAGQGSVEMMTTSGVASSAVDWSSRSGQAHAVSTPEELIAAAQATCFNMALAHQLSAAGTPPAHLETTVEVGFSPVKGITGIVLHVTGHVPGLDHDEFVGLASSAKEICTVARALAGTTIRLEAALAPCQDGPDDPDRGCVVHPEAGR